ncbi:MAG TPA: hypothetical protein DEP51_04865 [Clostridiales bacterium]|nr:hypothetical protein [Clostridiales bacterium]
MKQKNKHKKRKKQSNKPTKTILLIIIIALIGVGGYFAFNYFSANPAQYLEEYVAKINEEKYEEMYQMLDDESKSKISEEDFIKRNKNIYSGIDMANMQITVNEINREGTSKAKVQYTTKMNTSGGEINFDNTAVLIKKENVYKINWSSNLIFPNLNETDKVKVSSNKALRGSIIDRDGAKLATNGKASSVGIVPNKLGDNKQENIDKMAELLRTTPESINNKLGASWVKDETFVPIKSIIADDTELKNKLLTIPGVKITSIDARVYPLAEASSHLTGYVGQVTKEDLEKNPGYSANSVIGKTGLEKIYEERLKGKDGLQIYIVDEQGNKKETILEQDKKDGEDVRLTIDSRIQKNLYNELKNDEGAFVVMDYKTGEILALVSTPSYDVNKMTLGVTTEEWKEISENEKTPMLARFLQSYCPGSTFKPLTGAIGLTSGSLSTDDTFNYSGLSWRKDSSWGDFNITTLTAYNGPKNLKNALIYSDNIYFAQATLKIGKTNFIDGLKKIKFGETVDFEMNLAKSKYSNSDTISSEGQLANSGYGQGEILVNPVHMASIYSAFVNDGNMLKPYLEYKEDKNPEFLVEGAFSKDATDVIKSDMIQVVEQGTAKDMKINGITIAGKTGTAELKASKDEKADTIGWFDCFTVDYETPYLIIGMVEKANENGGSHYLIPMIKRMFIK